MPNRHVPMTAVLENETPLQTEYLPSKFIDRTDETVELQSTFSNLKESPSRNLHISGPRGSGKTHLVHHVLEDLPDGVNTCFIRCSVYDTQYKILRELYQAVTRESINDGYHVSDLQRKIEDRIGAVQTVLVLDEIDFALLNNGDSLLYYLSRIDGQDKLSIVTISANQRELPIEERTQSSLQPQKIQFDPYTGEETYEILRQRAEDSLQPRSLQRNALTYIASTTNNIKIGLHWLQVAAKEADDAITEEHVQTVKEQAYQNYTEELLQPFTTHHNLVYQAIRESASEDDQVVQSGEIYTGYEQLCHSSDEEPLSNRRISDYLKHLELLNLIEAEYHYGGPKGKTREIQLRV